MAGLLAIQDDHLGIPTKRHGGANGVAVHVGEMLRSFWSAVGSTQRDIIVRNGEILMMLQYSSANFIFSNPESKVSSSHRSMRMVILGLVLAGTQMDVDVEDIVQTRPWQQGQTPLQYC